LGKEQPLYAIDVKNTFRNQGLPFSPEPADVFLFMRKGLTIGQARRSPSAASRLFGNLLWYMIKLAFRASKW
jgi:hypothetical protein